jgi:hypothetical protein
VRSKRSSNSDLHHPTSHEAHEKGPTQGPDEEDTPRNAFGAQQVNLDTPTGPVGYKLPLSIDETYSSTEVTKRLYPSNTGDRDTVQNQRRSNKLLGLPIDEDHHRFPKFQIDEARHKIRPVVAYANQILECNEDPWGTLDWWYTEDEARNGQRPVDLLATGELTQELIDFKVKLGKQAMD